MRAFAAVFTREIFERRFAFVVAFAAGFVPLIGSLAYGWRSPDAAEGRVLVALVGATALSAAFALLLGAAVIVGETKEKRISFYFSRPIPSGAIWAGKLLAAIFITLVTAFLAFTPGWLSGTAPARSLWGVDATLGRVALAALALAVVLVLGSHAVVTIARLRSPWVALDLILAPTLVFLAAACLRSLIRDSGSELFQVRGPARAAIILLAVAPFLGLLVASFIQVAQGRTDARRAHGAFSVIFFGIVGAVVAALGGYAWWCASAKATDLEEVWRGVETAPQGSWLAAGGPLQAWRGGGVFLFDPSSARSIRVRSWNVVFSRDGTRAAWGEARFGFFEKTRKAEIRLADLVSGRTVETGLESDSEWTILELSPDGKRLALRGATSVEVFDVSNPTNPRLLAVLPHEGRGFAFVDDDTLRVFPRAYNARSQKITEAQLEITDLFIPSRTSLVTGRLERETLPFLSLSPDGRLFVGVRSLSDDPRGKRALTLHDGKTGALVSTLAQDLSSPRLRFLTGAKIAVAGIAGAEGRLLSFEAGKGWGAPSHSVDLGPAKSVVLGGEVAPGQVAVALNPLQLDGTVSPSVWKLAFVDVTNGSVSTGPPGLLPVAGQGWWSPSAVLHPAAAGSPSSLLCYDARWRLVRLDPATGARTVLLGKGK